ncbi:phosphate butyryltransferase, partial [Desulfovibrio oxamicus]|nr:phosphate butyryltransferase [Nitratidesulfovibrio oxamicus]
MTTEAKICQGPHTGGLGPSSLDELVARVAVCGARPRIALAACAEAHALGAL